MKTRANFKKRSDYFLWLLYVEELRLQSNPQEYLIDQLLTEEEAVYCEIEKLDL